MATRPTLKPLAFILILFLLGALAAGNYFVLPHVLAGTCSEWLSALVGNALHLDCLYYFVGAPLVVGLLLVLTLPFLVTSGAMRQETKPAPVPVDKKKPAPTPVTAKPVPATTLQLLALLPRERRLKEVY